MTTTAPSTLRPSRARWRVVDIVVAAVLGVACGLVFLLWNGASQIPSELLQSVLPGLQGLANGFWLFAGVLGGLIIRKPGAALFTEVLAAVVSGLIGNQWGGFLTIEAGLVQGLGAELVFAIVLYRRWNLSVALVAGAAAGLFGAVNDLILWYPGADVVFGTAYLVTSFISGIAIAGLVSWLLARGLARTGALNRFESGRSSDRRV